jgi:hypothetical protein
MRPIGNTEQSRQFESVWEELETRTYIQQRQSAFRSFHRLGPALDQPPLLRLLSLVQQKMRLGTDPRMLLILLLQPPLMLWRQSQKQHWQLVKLLNWLGRQFEISTEVIEPVHLGKL